MPPLVLRMLFEDLRPDCSSLHYDALATAGAGAPASRLTRAADAALGFKATVQVCVWGYDMAVRSTLAWTLLSQVMARVAPLGLQKRHRC